MRSIKFCRPSRDSRRGLLEANHKEFSPIQHLPPGYFALVMATGIVSMALDSQGQRLPAQTLFFINIAAYSILWVLFLWRFLEFRASFMGDLLHHDRAAGFLTIVAATCVLGVQFYLLSPWTFGAVLLWFGGGALWIILNYTFFSIVILHEPKPSLDRGINSEWLLAVVAIESLAVLGVHMAPELSIKGIVLFSALVAMLAGAMIYLCLITLIFYRWMFFPIKPEKLTPDYWINMGALAITALAGSMLLLAYKEEPQFQSLTSFIAGVTLTAWAFGLWWIPLLVIASVWKFEWGQFSWNYDPHYWAMVFPLGMFSYATDMLEKSLGLNFLAPLGKIFAAIAFLTWAWGFGGLLLSLLRNTRMSAQP